MNLIVRRICPILLVAFSGCDSKTSENAAAELATESVALFEAGKGVLFTEETRKLLEVKIVAATEKPMRRSLEKSAEVYRAARGEKPGAALVWCSEVEAKALRLDQRVTLRGANDTDVPGKLVRLDPRAHAGRGQIEALIEFDDPSGAVRAGAFVTATFVDPASTSMLAVPVSALLDAADGCYVYTVNGSHLTRTRVKTGSSHEGYVGIEDGLQAGDVVAAKGVDNLWLVELSALKGGAPCCPVPKNESVQ